MATNFVVAGVLLFVLAIISFLYDQQIDWSFALLLACVCCLPAIYTVIFYLYRARSQVSVLKERIAKLERDLFPRAGQ